MKYIEDIKKVGIDFVKTLIVDNVLYWGGCVVTYITVTNLVDLGLKILKIMPEGKALAMIGKAVLVLTVVGGVVTEIAIVSEYGIGMELDEDVYQLSEKINSEKKAQLNTQKIQ